MSDRYNEVLSIKENLYDTETPILISKGILIKDNSQKEKIFIHLVFQNIEDTARNITTVKVALTTYDKAGNVLEDSIEYQYLNLNVARGQEFGFEQQIPLKNSCAQSFDISVLKIEFSEGIPWTVTQQNWVSLGRQKTLEESLGNQLAEQYRRETFPNATYEIFARSGVWMCACGTLNKTSESQCYTCHNMKRKLFCALDHNFLANSLNKTNTF